MTRLCKVCAAVVTRVCVCIEGMCVGEGSVGNLFVCVYELKTITLINILL